MVYHIIIVVIFIISFFLACLPRLKLSHCIGKRAILIFYHLSVILQTSKSQFVVLLWKSALSGLWWWKWVFECSKCKQPVTRIFPDGKYSPPSICNLNGCKSKFFIPLRSTAQTIDFQKIRSAWCLTHYLYSLTYVGASVH